MPVSDRDRRKLQLAQLEIAKSLAELCDRHGLKYFFLGGSALGARRHQGFIPWDDDMDIGMLREDFDRFIMLARRELPSSLYLQYWLDDLNMGILFAKLRLNNTRVLEGWSKDLGGHKGISVDIFPFDNVPNGLAKYAWELQLLFWKRFLRHQAGYVFNKRQPLLLAGADAVTRSLSRILPRRWIRSRIHRLMTRYRDRPTPRVLAIGGVYGFKKDILNREWVSEVVHLPFEGHMFACPGRLDEYLRHMYGDFMQYPPLEEQRGHNILEVCFDVSGEREESAPLQAQAGE